MTRYVLLILAALVVLFLPVLAYGQTCRPGTVCNTPVVTTVVATPTVVLPIYGAVYAPSYGGTADETNRLLAEMLAEQKALRAELMSMKGGGVVARDPKPLLKNNCAGCHTEGRLAMGTDFSMFDASGEMYALSSIDRKTMARRLQNGTMPPPVTEMGGLKVQKMVAADRADLAGLLLNPPPTPAPKPSPVPVPPIPASLPEPIVPTVPKK